MSSSSDSLLKAKNEYYDDYDPQTPSSASSPTKAHAPPPAPHHYTEDIDTQKRRKTYSTSKELYRTTPAPALRQLLLKEEKETRDLRRLLNKALLQLNAQRASASSTRYQQSHTTLSDAQNIVEHSKLMDAISEARLSTTRAQHEADVNQALLDNAKMEVDNMRRRLKTAEEERDEALHSASKARAIARRLREEKDVMFAREEGRRRGFDEGLERAKLLAMSQKLIVYEPQDRGGGIARIEEHEERSPSPPPRTRSSSKTTESSQRRQRERQVSDPLPPPPPVEEPPRPVERERRRRHSVDTESQPQRPPSADSKRSEEPVPVMPEPVPAPPMPPFELEYVRMPSPPVQRQRQRSSMPSPAPMPVPPPAIRTHKRSASDSTNITMNSPASTMTGISSTLDNELLSFPEQQQQRQRQNNFPRMTRTLSDIPEIRTPTPSQQSSRIAPSPYLKRDRVDEWRKSSSSAASPPGPPDDFFRKPNPSPARSDRLVERHTGPIGVDVFAPSPQSSRISSSGPPAGRSVETLLSPHSVPRTITTPALPPPVIVNRPAEGFEIQRGTTPVDRRFQVPGRTTTVSTTTASSVSGGGRRSTTPAPIYSASGVRGNTHRKEKKIEAAKRKGKQNANIDASTASSSSSTTSNSTTTTSEEEEEEETEREEDTGVHKMPMSPHTIYGGLPNPGGVSATPRSPYSGLPGVPSTTTSTGTAATPRTNYYGLPGTATTPRANAHGLPGAAAIYGPPSAAPAPSTTPRANIYGPPDLPAAQPVIPVIPQTKVKKSKKGKKAAQQQSMMTPGGSAIYSGLPSASAIPKSPAAAIYSGLPGGPPTTPRGTHQMYAPPGGETPPITIEPPSTIHSGQSPFGGVPPMLYTDESQSQHDDDEESEDLDEATKANTAANSQRLGPTWAPPPVYGVQHGGYGR